MLRLKQNRSKVSVEKELAESNRQLVKANERNHNLQQEIKTILENKKLIEDNLKQEIERLNEELKAERDFRRDRQQYNEIDHKKSFGPCSFINSCLGLYHLKALIIKFIFNPKTRSLSMQKVRKTFSAFYKQFILRTKKI